MAFQQGTQVLLVFKSAAHYHYALYLRRTGAAWCWPFLIWIDAVVIHWTSFVHAVPSFSVQWALTGGQYNIKPLFHTKELAGIV